MANEIGFLPYGSTDSSVIFRRNLLARPTTAGTVAGDVGTCTVTDEGTGAIYDPVKGLINTVGNDISIGSINGSTASMGNVANAGQIYLEVETSMLACSNAQSEYSSGGVAQVGAENIISFAASPYVNGNYIHSLIISNKALGGSAGYGSNIAIIGGSSFFSDAIGQTDFTPMVIAFNGGKVQFYINGVEFASLAKLNWITFALNQIFLARYVGALATQNLLSGHIRNLQVSNLPVRFNTIRGTEKTITFGDSYSQSIALYQSTDYNLGKYVAFRSTLRKAGWDCGSYLNDATTSFAGRQVIGTNGTWNVADAAATYLAPNMATMLANKPTTIIFQAGANDLTTNGSMSQVGFQTSMQGFITQAFATSYVKKLIICNTPWANTYQGVATANLRLPDVLKIKAAIDALPAWVATNYPTRTADVVICDMFTAYGGLTGDTTYFGTGDLLHPGNKGNYVMGKTWANSLLSLIKS